MKAVVPRVADFTPDGTGTAAAWGHAAAFPLRPIKGNAAYATQVKLLYSAHGFYCHFDCQDRTLTCTDPPDHGDLFTQDVVELFLWPDEKYPVYFEYELSPLGRELPLLVCNNGGRFMGWSPWKYEGDRRVKKAVGVRGQATPGGSVTGWSAEIFVPFALLTGLSNVPPEPGAVWRGNFHRIDYDAGQSWFAWAGSGQETFHDPGQFGFVHFGE